MRFYKKAFFFLNGESTKGLSPDVFYKPKIRKNIKRIYIHTFRIQILHWIYKEVNKYILKIYLTLQCYVVWVVL